MSKKIINFFEVEFSDGCPEKFSGKVLRAINKELISVLGFQSGWRFKIDEKTEEGVSFKIEEIISLINDHNDRKNDHEWSIDHDEDNNTILWLRRSKELEDQLASAQNNKKP